MREHDAAGMSMETVRHAVSFLRDRPHGRNAISVDQCQGRRSIGGRRERHGAERRGRHLMRQVWRRYADPLARDYARDPHTSLADRSQRIDPGRGPGADPNLYGFSIAGLMADGQAAVNRAAPADLRAPRFTARSAPAGSDGSQDSRRASGGRAVVDDNEPARVVPAIFEENSAYYMIGYKATYGLSDGRAHRLKIRVNRPGVTVFPSDRLAAVGEAGGGQDVKEPPAPLLRAMAELVPRSDLQPGGVTAPFRVSRRPAIRRRRQPGSWRRFASSARRPRNARPSRSRCWPRCSRPRARRSGRSLRTRPVRLRPSDRNAQFDVLTPLGLRSLAATTCASLAHSVQAQQDRERLYGRHRCRIFREGQAVALGPRSSAPSRAPSAAPTDAFATIIPAVPTTRREF